MKILLADPPGKGQRYDRDYPNLGILYLTGYLRSRWEGSDLDISYLEGDCSLKEHLQRVRDYTPDIYGISFAALTSQLSFRTINAVKDINPSFPVICGGAHPTSSPEEVLEKSGADICVLGEGEQTFLELVNHFAAEATLEQQQRLGTIDGIAYKKNGRIVRTEKRSLIKDIDSMPFPAWDLIDFRKYPGMHLRKKNPQSYIMVSRGCPFDCNFCSNPVWKHNKPWLRLRGAESIVGEIKLLYTRGVREIYLNADEFNVSIEWALEVCEAIRCLDLNDLYFQCNLRADKGTEELARVFKKINLWMVLIGIESGNQKTLNGIGKRITLEQVVNTCRIFKKAGLMVYGYMMLYHVWEEEGKLCWESSEDVENTLRFSRKLLSQGLIDYISWQVATPFPGSRLWETAQRHNLFIPGHDIHTVREDNLNLPNVSPKQVQRSVKKGLLLKNYYALRRGNISWRHWSRVWSNVRTLLRF